MLHNERNTFLDANFDSLRCISEEKSIQASMLYSILPTIVASRVPTLPSLRRSVSELRTRSLHSKSKSLTEISPLGTPPPCYTSRPGSGSVTPDISFAAPGFDLADECSERPTSSSSSFQPLSVTCESGTGVNWRYASQGISLMSQAYREASSPIRDFDETCTSLTRQLYMHGMAYLLQGLPATLTPEETTSLRAAIPQGLIGLPAGPSMHALIPVSHRTSVSQEGPPQEPTILHRITATCVFQIIMLVQFLLPYMKVLLAQAYQFERRHQITRRMIDTGITTVDGLGRRSLKLSQMVCQMNDGKVGQAINEMTLLCVRSVTGGIQQGIEEGLITTRPVPERSRRRAAEEKSN